MKSLTDRLNSGEIHDALRKRHFDCVDSVGNIHRTPERAAFVNWTRTVRAEFGWNHDDWPPHVRAEYRLRYVSS